MNNSLPKYPWQEQPTLAFAEFDEVLDFVKINSEN
jgi:hypothetical protein